MYKMDEVYLKNTDKQNRLATATIIAVGVIVALIYMVGLVVVLSNSISTVDSSAIFIRSFSVILAGFAVASCILCYISSNKEEVFIISLMYMVFIIDIAFGNVDGMSLTSEAMDTNTYIMVVTSLVRISILMILIFPFKKTRKFIINNKIKSICVVVLLTLIISCLKLYNITFLDFNTTEMFIYYNVFLIFVYILFAVRFAIKSIKQREYIYSVISMSVFFFGIKATYAVFSSIVPTYNIKLLCISTTYMGFIIFIGGVLTELAMSIQRNKRLKNEIAIFYNLVDESKDTCIFILDENQDIKYTNKALKSYTINTFGENISNIESIFTKLKDEIGTDLLEEAKESIKTTGSWKGNIELSSVDSTIDCVIQNIYTYDEKIYAACIFRDISQRVRMETRLIEYEKIKNHENIKNEFFANISHELRTPLNIFYSTIQLLEIKSKDYTQDFVGVYDRHKQSLKINCQRMLRLINNIVDITKIDVGFTTPKFVNCDIVSLVEDITLSVINYANPKNIDIVFDTLMEEHRIKCDPAMIERAMLNLLSNAIKFTKDKGNILVSLHYDKEWVYIRVKDDGIGIPIDVQGIIFERFVQGDRSLTRLNEGSGIGLSIVKSIIELNEGEIYLESDEDNGTEFEIRLPNRVLLCDNIDSSTNYEVDVQKIELELSDIYKLYE